MKLAVMQPYLFPYLGYFQLIYAADLFLIYDDVAYIKQGFINRNNVLTKNGITRFTVPVSGASSNKLISELQFSEEVGKVLKTIEQGYSKALCFNDVFPIIKKILEFHDRSISSMCQLSYEEIFSYLGIAKKFKKTSELEYNRSICARDRLIDLCQKFGSNCYINASGGRALYTKTDFADKGIELKFIDMLPVEYSQRKEGFVPNLSIIDILMNCSPEEVVSLLKCYDLA